ncbi:MAG: hypothetical protein HY736_12860 [Verrucomicrobia bacterium]|nr:hypothetical protein [Verrucomicrobiota bacterium]
MMTLTATKARSNLTKWLKRAAAGEDIGIACGTKEIALRLTVALPPDDGYAKREYGVTDAELDKFVRRMDAELEHDRKAGRMRRFTGDLDAALRD